MVSKNLTLAVLSLFIGLGAVAQTRNFRDKGVRGSVAFTDQLVVFVGADASLGYMFDRKNCLGGGIGVFMLPKDEGIPVYGNLYADYRHYFKNDGKSMFIGSKAGWTRAFSYERDTGVEYCDGILLEPNFGWSWTLESGHGLALGLGATLISPIGESRTAKDILALPKLSILFHF